MRYCLYAIHHPIFHVIDQSRSQWTNGLYIGCGTDSFWVNSFGVLMRSPPPSLLRDRGSRSHLPATRTKQRERSQGLVLATRNATTHRRQTIARLHLTFPPPRG